MALLALFSVSAAYHRWRWGQRGKALLRRADHSTILVFIAGTFTPVTVATTAGAERLILLTAMWAAAGLGMTIRMVWHNARAGAIAAVYSLVGLCGIGVLPALLGHSGPAAFVLFTAGGVIYLLGATVYARRSPDPRPAVFGYHEVFHSLTVLATALQYVAVSLAVGATG